MLTTRWVPEGTHDSKPHTAHRKTSVPPSTVLCTWAQREESPSPTESWAHAHNEAEAPLKVAQSALAHSHSDAEIPRMAPKDKEKGLLPPETMFDLEGESLHLVQVEDRVEIGSWESTYFRLEAKAVTHQESMEHNSQVVERLCDYYSVQLWHDKKQCDTE